MSIVKRIRLIFSSNKKFYYSIKNIFGFYPGNIFLYELALRHRSAPRTVTKGVRISNERLEYLGDAVLGAIIADLLFRKFPYKDEGFLTEMRSKIVNRSQLSKLSKKLGIMKLIQSNTEPKAICKSMPGDAFEALVGAIYLDKGYSFTSKIIINRIINVHFDIDELIHHNENYKSKLIEWIQKEKKEIAFNVLKEIGEGYNKQYLVEIEIDDEPMAQGQDFSIKAAEQHASEKTLKKIASAQE